MSFDLAEKRKLAAAHDRGIDVPIKDEHGKPALQSDGKTPITISVVGSLSKRYKQFQAIQRGRIMNAASAGDADKEKDDETVGRKSLEEQTEGVARCITGWTPGFTDGGKPFEYSEANAVLLLTENPDIQTQLEAAMRDHARFFAKTSTAAGK